jgi:signal transduction histidine kinase
MKKLPLWIALAGVAIIAFAAIQGGLSSSAERNEAERWQDHTRAVQLQILDALIALEDAETGQRGYIITADPSYLEPYEKGRNEVWTDLAQLDELLADNPEQEARVVKLRVAAKAKLEELAETVELVRAGNQAGAVAKIKLGHGKALMDEARANIAGIAARETQILADRRREALAAAGRESEYLWALFAIGALALLGATVATIYAVQTEAQAALEKEAVRRRAVTRLAHAQRLEALGQLAGGVAHDFNNVLQSVQSAARVIERRPEDAANVRRLAQIVAQGAERGKGVTQRLLIFARRGELRSEPVDAAALFVGLREMLAHTLGAGVKLRIETAPGLAPFETDKAQLETVLVNLATNARDAMEGAGTLTFFAACDENPDPQLKPGRYMHIAVIDTGCGMAPEILARASEPFFTTKPQGVGTGLGLAMARGFAEQSGGAFKMDSELGRGTSVHLWLPVTIENPSPPLAQAEEQEEGYHGPLVERPN